MKHTRKILVALLVLMSILMSLAAVAIPASAAQPSKLYLDPNSNWSSSNAWFAAYFFGNGTTWVKMADSNGDGIYEVDVPTSKSYPSVIFCRMNSGNTSTLDWSNVWNQTSDLTVPTNGNNSYSVADGAWSKGSGSWGKMAYTVAGSSGLLGTDWTVTDTNNDMVLNASGVYEKVYSEVAGGTYEFKIAANHGWRHNWGADGVKGGSNISLVVGDDNCTVTITFNDTTKTITSTVVDHSWVDADCDTAKTCSLCGKTDGDPLGHDTVVDSAVPATCIATGLTEGSHCSRCDDATVAQTETAATGNHSFVDEVCSVCGAKQLVSKAESTESLNIFSTEGVLASDSSSISWAGANFTLTNEKGSTAIRTSDSNHFRAYSGSRTTISGSGITKVVITCTSSDYATVCANSLSTSGVTATVDGSVVTLTVDSGSIDEILIGATAQWRFNAVEVTSGGGECSHTNTTTTLVDATCEENGQIIIKCVDCEESTSADNANAPALGHDINDEHICTRCGADDPDYYFEMTISEALAAAEGKQVQISGTVVGIYQAYNDSFNNISVYLEDANGDQILLFRLSGNVSLHDIITVQGVISLYNSVNQVTNGTFVLDGTEECTFSEATCTEAAKCEICGATSGEALGHTTDNGTCERCGDEIGGEVETVTNSYVFSDYTAGTQYAEDEKHVLDETVTITTTQCHFTTQLRIYSSSTHNGYAVITSTNPITAIGVNAGNKADTLVVYGSNDNGATWTQIGEIATASSYKDYTLEFDTSYTSLKLDVSGANQVRVASMTLTTEISAGGSEEECTHTNKTTTTVDADCYNAGSTTVTCDDCGEVVSTTEIPAKGHTEVTDAAVEATCTEKGLTEGKHCSVCGEVISAQAEVQATGHKDVTDKAVAPTCTETGKTEGSHCGVCNEVLVPQTVVDALGHTEGAAVEENKNDSTCSAKGSYDSVVYCSVCGVEISRTSVEIEKKAHTVATDAAVAPTCTETGKTEGSHCSVCNEVLTEQTVVDALGHDMIVDAAVAPTCTETGLTEGSHCSRCDHKIAQTVVDALGHTEETVAGKAATCTETGLTDGKKCSVCGVTTIAQEVIASLGHSYEAVVTAPTFDAQGYTTYTCSECGDSYVDENSYVPALIAVAMIGDAKYETLADAVASITTDTVIKLLCDVEIGDIAVPDAASGSITFTADSPVTIKQTALSSDFDIVNSNITTVYVTENITVEIYDNSSGVYMYYGPSLDLKGTIVGGQNWGVLFLFQGEHVVHKGANVGAGRVQIGYTQMTVYGNVETNYLLVEGSTLIADGAVIDANVIYDNNNGAQRWGASEFVIKNGSAVTTSQLTLSYADSVLTIDSTSKLVAGKLVGEGSIVIDATGFSGFAQIIDLSGTESLEGKVTVNNLPEGVNVIYGADGDVYLSDANTSVLYVNSAYAGLEVGTAVTISNPLARSGSATIVAYVGVNAFASLEEAVAAAEDGDTVVMVSDVTLNSTVQIPADTAITIDLNGKTVSMTDSSSATACAIKNNGTLTITDNSDAKDGKIVFTSTTPSASNSYASNTISNYGTLTINGGVIENASVGCACYALDNYAGSTATVNGGRLIAVKTAVRIFNWTDGDSAKTTLNVNGGEIISDLGYGINLNMGNSPAVSLNIAGGTITTNDPNYNLAVYIINKGSAENLTVNVSGGTFDGNFALNGITSTTMAEGAISITDGKFDGAICYGEPAYGFISGGTFETKPEANLCASGLAFAENADGSIGIVNAVASIDGVGYASLDEALEMAADGETVTLLGNITLDNVLVLDKAITLDGTGFTLTSKADRAINVNCNGAVGIKNLTIVNGANAERAINVIQKAATLTVDNVVAEGFKYTVNVAASSVGSSITINGGKLSGYAAINLTGSNTTVVVNNAELVGVNDAPLHESNNFSVINVAADNVSVTVNGGKLTATSSNGNKQFILISQNCTGGYACIDAELGLVDGEILAADADDIEAYFRAEYADELAARGYVTKSASDGMVGVSGSVPYYIGANGNWFFNGEDTGHKAVATDGVSPEIGDNGNWWIGETDTGVKAEAINGSTPEIGENGNWWIGNTDTGVKAKAEDGKTPYVGDNGNWWIGTTDTNVNATAVIPHIGTNGNWFIGTTDTLIPATGKDGETPYIGTNGNWFIGTTDLGVAAKGEDGNDGETPYIGTNGNWWVGTTDLGAKAKGEDGETPSFKLEGGHLYAKFPSDTDWTDLGLVAGADGVSPEIGDNGNWWIGDIDTGVKAKAEDGKTPYVGDNDNWWIGDADTGVKAKAEDGKTPHVGGNGNWWIGDADTGVKARGEDGKTPSFKIEGGHLYVSFDNTNWTDLGNVTGEDGQTPYIGENGNWWIGDYDLGVKAKGEDGATGVTPHIGENGNWFIGDTDTGIRAVGKDGNDNNEIILLSIGIATLCLITTIVAVATRKYRFRWWILT